MKRTKEKGERKITKSNNSYKSLKGESNNLYLRDGEELGKKDKDCKI